MENITQCDIDIKSTKYTFIFVMIFITFNIIGAIIVLTASFNNHISPFEFRFLGFLNSVIADFAVLSLIAIICVLIFRRKTIFYIVLIVLTFGLNYGVIQVYVYSSFFQAIQTIRTTMQTLGNPVEGIWQSVMIATLRLIFLQFRFLFFTPTITLLLFYILKIRKIKETSNKRFTISFKRIALIGLASIFTWILTIFATTSMISNSDVATFDRPLFTIRHGGFYSFYLQDFLNVGVSEIEPISDEAGKFVDKFNVNVSADADGNFKYWNELAEDYFSRNDAQTGMFDGRNKNVFIIQIEAFQNSLIGAEINGIEVTPFMNELANINGPVDGPGYGSFPFSENRPAAQTFYFSNVLQSVGRGNTNDAELSVMTGLYGLHDDRLLQSFENDFLNETYSFDFDSLPRLFNQTHETTFFHGNDPVFYRRGTSFKHLFNFRHLNFRQEFVEFKGYNDVSSIPSRYLYKSWINDRSMLEFAIYESNRMLNYDSDKQYALGEEPEFIKNYFFNFITLVQPHAPFLNRGYIKERDWGREINRHNHISAYLNTVHYIDSVLRDMLTKAMYKLPNTLFVLYGDHGMAGGVRGNVLRNKLRVNSTIEETQELLSVPVIFIENPPYEAPTNWQGEISKSLENVDFKYNSKLVRSKRDIYRTVLNMFDMWDDVYEVFGVNMFTHEPSIAIAIRTSYFKTDSIFASLRNPNRIIKFDTSITQEEILRQRQVIRNHRDMNIYFLHSRRNKIR